MRWDFEIKIFSFLSPSPPSTLDCLKENKAENSSNGSQTNDERFIGDVYEIKEWWRFYPIVVWEEIWISIQFHIKEGLSILCSYICITWECTCCCMNLVSGEWHQNQLAHFSDWYWGCCLVQIMSSCSSQSCVTRSTDQWPRSVWTLLLQS